MKVLIAIMSVPFYVLCGVGWVGIGLYFLDARPDRANPTQSVLIDIALAIVGLIGIGICKAIDAKRRKAQSSPRI